MNASDVMTRDVISVSPLASLRDIAALLATRRISAVPVITEAGELVGMVSEGDLIGGSKGDQQTRRDWWLELLAEGELLNADYLASLRPAATRASDVMSAPVITVADSTELSDIARLLEEYHIKRVPVVRDGRVCGIVSRADLVRALASVSSPTDGLPSQTGNRLFGAIASIENRVKAHHVPGPAAAPIVAPATPANTVINAQRFRELSAAYRQREHQHHDDLQRTAAEHLQAEIKELAEHHVDETYWHDTLMRARESAERGESEYQLLRFPNALCSDGGRAINAPSADWPRTLRGEPAEIYLRWEHDLKPHGFHLTARVLEFPRGFPGDIGLFLSWGNRDNPR